MRRTRTALFLALLALTLSACGAASGGGEPDRGGTPLEKNPNYVNITSPDAPAPLVDEPDAPDHVHVPSQGDNIMDHDPAGYCGNTVTTVSCAAQPGGESWEASFWGDDSVVLTDLLLYLDYSGDVCKCLPEYRVDTEFGADYGINLTEGYVRHDGGQVSLTAEQTEQIQAILDRQAAQAGN